MKIKKNILDQIILEGQKNRPELEPGLVDQFFRIISKYFSLVFIRLKFTPNMITMLAITASIVGGLYLAQGNTSGYLMAAMFFFLFLLFDYCDGEMARTLGKQSISGNYLDYGAHFIMFASFMIGLSYGIYQYHSTNTYLILGFGGVSGILLRSIAELLLAEVVVRENLRLTKRLPMSNKDVSYSVKSEILDSPNINAESTSLIKDIIRILIRPSGGDDILVFYVPFTILLYIFPLPIFNGWDVRVVDIYFFYLCCINLILPFLLIFRNVYQKKAEIYYNDIFKN